MSVVREKKLFDLILSPILTEKTTSLAAFNQHAFKVQQWATKHDIKRAIQQLFSVQPKKVRVVNVKPKKTRNGSKSGWKKVYVTLADEQVMQLVESKA
jgi:large subunit ribosomal protein L23